jgi:hypothetical protein
MLKFKLNPIAAACAAALGLASASAAALTPFEAADPGLDIYLSGASAPQNTLGAIAGQLFEPGYIVYYSDGGDETKNTDDGVDYRAYFGVIKAGAPVDASLVGKKVRLIDRAKGGSVWGVNPLARAEKIATMAITDANCRDMASVPAASQTSGVAQLCLPTGSDTNPADPANRVPDFGVSDVAPNMFKGPLNVEAGAEQLSAVETARLKASGVNTLMMGLVATNGVPFGTYLSKADYASMLTGKITDFGSINPALAGKNVAVCRRVNGSGTQASYNWFFHNFPCTNGSIAGSGASTPLDILSNIGNGSIVGGSGAAGDPLLLDPTAGVVIVENSGSGDVRNCLKAANEGTDYSNSILVDDGSGTLSELYYTVKFSTSGAGTPAIGVLSLDSRGKESGWTFRSLDGAGHIDPGTGSAVCDTPDKCGVAPTKANLLAGDYEFSSELSMQYRNVEVAGVPKPSGDQLQFIQDFIKAAGSPTVIEGIASSGLRNASAALPIVHPASDPFVADATRNGNMCKALEKKI